MLDGAFRDCLPRVELRALDSHGISNTVVQKPNDAYNHQVGFTTLRPFAINIDWLTVNLHGADHTGLWTATEPRSWVDRETGEEFYTQPTDIKTGQFNKVAYLCNAQADKVATIYSEPHQRQNGEHWMQVQFANETLYTGEWAGLAQMIRNEGVEYRGTSRIDIACDGLRGNGGDWCAVMGAEMKGEARYYGKADSLTRRTRGKVIGGEFGTRRSNKFIRAYNKTEEMKAKGMKAHIVDKWCDALGFDPYKEEQVVERFELQCKGAEVRRHYPDERNADWLDRISDQRQLLAIYSNMVPGMFDYRATGAERARDAQPLTAWDWSLIEGQAPAKAERQRRNIGMSEHGLKASIAAIARLGIKQDEPITIELARQYAEDAGPMFLQWYASRFPLWLVREQQIRAAKCPLDAMIRKNHHLALHLHGDGEEIAD